ncbi:sugar ABC transporter ATP-binding protein [Anaerocellum diazotrophicum]|uniref:Autoinducer 2 import ATP-binding protein LsrA n=1 Tax=Caldicellulosiruptor diazotrophicus TaxID=2806205 RepID=A0ABN6E4S4_9FIRM|nr:sugar ABC transporter ATP-binding protein [Caldicellulosiruptor diazotrophicus]BCS80380.1 ribose import ATP-binding protein RbsA [Caldicellulosiruptor diazotrophicus]
MSIVLKNVSMKYDDFYALKDINLELFEGKVNVILGKNGSGKTTITKIINGSIAPTSGKIVIDGKEFSTLNPMVAKSLGIFTVHQELLYFPHLSVAENIFIDNKPKNRFGFVSYRTMIKQTSEILSKMGVYINPEALCKNLGQSQLQVIEICRALVQNAKVLIFDEPTAGLTTYEIENLFRIIKELKQKGINVIFVTNMVEEALSIADRITILRDGKVVASDSVTSFNLNKVISLIFGRVDRTYPKLKVDKGEIIFSVKNLTKRGIIENISFDVREGEVFGIAGLVGSGRSFLAKALFGAEKLDSGEIYMNGTLLKISSPADAIKNGIAFMSEDRIGTGLFKTLNIADNIISSNIWNIANGFFVDSTRQEKIANLYIKKLGIKPKEISQKIAFLSGGNQQKVLIAKWLFSRSNVFILDEPTKGLDLASKVEVYNIINELTRIGCAIIFISSDFSELIGMCDRILVLREGKKVHEFSKKEMDYDRILKSAMGSLESK